MALPENKKRSFANRFIGSIRNSISGICLSYKTEQSLWIHLFFTVVMIVLGILTKVAFYEWILLFLMMGLILVAELINTAIESLTDLVTTEIHPLAKRAKDVASAAVFVMTMLTVIIGSIIFISNIV